ncbi:hypothetical protein HMN09_00643400 [Mycena chlorophos]|uniref:EamA domain-containing protein n=1 Tax=Mycena chlorophos TaxID=658473 RepID=A0A8H6T2R3_MYCCL|nr:hypothetical protein HMN09_00643400 [Mycena chlorophos]
MSEAFAERASRTPVHIPTVRTAPPWAQDEPPSPAEEHSSQLHAINATESRPSVTSFSTHASKEPSRWNTFATRPRGASNAALAQPSTSGTDRKNLSFKERSISWLPSQRDGSSFPRRQRQPSRATSINRNWDLSIVLPTPPTLAASTAYTLQHNATPGWDVPWTSRVGAQGPAGRHLAEGSDEESPVDSEKEAELRHRRRHQLRLFILSNAYVPLIFRFINLSFTTAALALAIKIRALERRLHTTQQLGSSPTVVIIFAPLTLFHVLTSLYLEYFGRPLGLWRTSHKLAHTLSEVLFICCWAAALSLCFDNFLTFCTSTTWYSNVPPPTTTAQPAPDSRCDDQVALIVLVFIGLLAYCANLVISLFRIFHKRPVSRVARLRAVSRLRATRDYAVGIGLLILVVVLWTASNFVTQGMYDGGYEKPFLVTYLNTASFALYLVPVWFRRWLKGRREDSGARTPTHAYQPLAVDSEADHSLVPPTVSPEAALPPLTTQETTRLALIFCSLWFIANWTLNASLDHTSVASATILSSTSGFFTFGIGRIFRVETFTIAKIAALVTSFTGVVLVSLSDSIQPQQPAGAASRPLAHIEDLAPRPIFGDILAIVSAIFYACYVILLKVRIRTESRINMQLFFGYVGLFNILLYWPIGILLHIFGLEHFELPSRRAAAALLINMGITLTSDFLYVLAMLKTTPLVVTVGLSLTIPLAVLGDFMLGRFTRGQVIFGALLVLLSFVVVGLDNEKIKRREGVIEEVSDEESEDRPVE